MQQNITFDPNQPFEEVGDELPKTQVLKFDPNQPFEEVDTQEPSSVLSEVDFTKGLNKKLNDPKVSVDDLINFAEENGRSVKQLPKIVDNWKIWKAHNRKGNPVPSAVPYEDETPIAKAAPKRGLVDRFLDSFDLATSKAGQGEVGALSRAVEDFFNLDDAHQSQILPHLSAEQREQLRDARLVDEVKDLRGQAAALNAADPSFREDGSTVGNIARAAADLTGDIAGNVNPTYLLGGGRTVAQRVAAQAGISGGIDAAIQGTEISQGIEEEFDFERLALNTAAGGLVQGAGEGVAKGVSKLRGTDTPTSSDIEVEQDEVLQKFSSILSENKPLVNKQKEINTQTRQEKLQAIEQIKNNPNLSGQDKAIAMRAALKGEHAKVQGQTVQEKLDSEDITSLFDRISDHKPFTSSFQTITAHSGLLKILKGDVPVPSEMKLLEQVFPKEIISKVSAKKGLGDKIYDTTVDIVGLPRTLMSSYDFSAPFRQGIGLVHKKEFWKNIGPMFRAAWSDDYHRQVVQEIQNRPNFDRMVDSKLALTEIGGDISKREEDFISNLGAKIPGVSASNRAYSTFLNKLRADTFDSLLSNAKKAGIDIDGDPKAVEQISAFINAASGRGNLNVTPFEKANDVLEKSGPALTALFFSPRLIASRVQMLSGGAGQFGLLTNPVARKEYVKSLIAMGTLATTTLSLFKANGYDVEDDPRSSDFAKIKSGDTRYDILGGHSQYLTLGARLSTNSTVSLKGNERELNGEGPFGRTKGDVLSRFGRNKLSPVASYFVDYLQGENVIGEEFEAGPDLVKRLVPLFVQDVAEISEEEGLATGFAKASPALVGIGFQNFSLDDHKPKEEIPNIPEEEELFSEGAVENQEVLEAPQQVSEEPRFDPNQPFEVTTPENYEVTSLLEDEGFVVTDSDVRPLEDQRRYFNQAGGRGVSAPGTSSHEFGQAIDVRVPKGKTPSQVKKLLESKGYRGIRIITQTHGTGPHWHIEWESKE